MIFFRTTSERRRKEEAVSNWNENSPGYRQMAA